MKDGDEGEGDTAQRDKRRDRILVNVKGRVKAKDSREAGVVRR